MFSCLIGQLKILNNFLSFLNDMIVYTTLDMYHFNTQSLNDTRSSHGAIFSLHLEAYFPYFHLFDFIHLKLQGYLYSDALIISINLANNIIFWQQQLRHGVCWNYNRLNEKVGNTTRANPLSWLTQCHPRTHPPSTPQLAKLMFVPDNHVLSLHTANLISPLRCLPRNFVAKLAVWQKFIVGRDLEKRRVQGRSLNGRNNI